MHSYSYDSNLQQKVARYRPVDRTVNNQMFFFPHRPQCFCLSRGFLPCGFLCPRCHFKTPCCIYLAGSGDTSESIGWSWFCDD